MRRYILLAVATLALAGTVSAQCFSTCLPNPWPVPATGDIDSDGSVTIVDALRIAQHSVGIVDMTQVVGDGGRSLIAADVNTSGLVSIIDAVIIAISLVGGPPLSPWHAGHSCVVTIIEQQDTVIGTGPTSYAFRDEDVEVQLFNGGPCTGSGCSRPQPYNWALEPLEPQLPQVEQWYWAGICTQPCGDPDWCLSVITLWITGRTGWQQPIGPILHILDIRGFPLRQGGPFFDVTIGQY